MNAKQIVEASAKRAAEVVLKRYIVLGDCCNLLEDAKAISGEFAWVVELIEAARRVPDPEDEGFCSSCGTRLALKQIGDQYLWQHKAGCWYGDLVAAIPQGEKGE